ncbi:Ig-like domain-containing protein [Winogradskyella vincentii]|uniref:Ig-like domain-containing protein n=1 Tax=Winogradskyella vincentii TaxID=2877122 RepID=A0ABS7Y301_9FLAO|nr:Ig-like domain-containing protein [Winogradskyella vincentii]MCA0153002.1 Ig-like domain-containing protein [Winogradskyella vincentii]
MNIFRSLLICIKYYAIGLLFLSLLTTNSHSQQLAFPSAKGAGAYATGGRGGIVVHVTNLSDPVKNVNGTWVPDTDHPDWVGCYRWAITDPSLRTQDRTIVFDVSGVIELNLSMYLQNGGGFEDTNYPYTGGITIAGFTAPEGGITILRNRHNFKWFPSTIIRGIKYRGGYTNGDLNGNDEKRGFALTSRESAIADHISVGLSTKSTHTVEGGVASDGWGSTAQNNLIYLAGEGGLYGGTNSNSSNPPLDRTKYTEVSFLRNVTVDGGWRNPNVHGHTRIDIINNLIFNWRKHVGSFGISSYNFPDVYKVNLIGNENIGGFDGRQSSGDNTEDVAYQISSVSSGGAEFHLSDVEFRSASGLTGSNSIMRGRLLNYDKDDPDTYYWAFSGRCNSCTQDSEIDANPQWFTESQHPLLANLTESDILPSSQLKNELLPNVGACYYTDDNGNLQFYRDALDLEAINRITNEPSTGRDTSSKQAMAESLKLGGANEVPHHTRPANFYQSNPHIPEAWLVARGIIGNPNIHNEVQSDGYTLLEHYINQIDNLLMGNVEATAVDVTPEVATLNVLETLDLDVQFTPVNTTNQTGVWTSENDGIATVDSNGLVTGVSEGVVEIRFVSNDGGFEDISLITVVPQPVIADAGSDQAICEGDSVVLSASGGAEYLWSTGETTQSITVSPSTTQSYTVTVSDGNQEDSDEVMVFVDTLPILNISQDVTIFEGESTVLSVEGASDYLWDTGETTSSITVSPSVTTTYTVTGSNGVCEVQEQVTVTVEEIFEAMAGEDQTICEGDSVVLTATGGSDYLWSTGETTQSITVSPATTQTYTVTVSDGVQEDTDDVSVFVDIMPILNVSEDLTIFEGESTVLTVEGASDYLWNTGETTSSITVSPSVTTTYTVTGSNGVCEVQEQVTVTVEEIFVATAGDDVRICEGSGDEVTLNAGDGDSYLWNTGETTQSIIVSPLSTTTYSVVVTSGIQEDSDDVTVFVDPNPNVVIVNGDSVDILNGDFITLSATGANSYEWNNGATQPNIAVSPSTTTTYEVRGYINDCYDEKQVTVNVYEPVQAYAGEDVSICLNEVATLTATGGDEFLWSTGETTQSIQVSPFITTDYTVTVFNALDFDEATVRVTVQGQCNESTESPNNDLSDDVSFNIYPNPAYSYVNVRLNGASDVSDVLIYDFTGKIVQQNRIENQNQQQEINSRIELRTLSNGIYFVKLVDTNGNEITKKLIVRDL